MNDIIYTDKYIITPVDGDVLINTPALAFQKNLVWNYETETRIMMFTNKFQYGDTPKKIDFLLDFSKIKHIDIVFDPWMEPEIKQSIELTSRYYLKDYGDKLSFHNSELEGKIW